MGLTTICFISLCFILFPALNIANAELILLRHQDTLYCLGSREKGEEGISKRTSFIGHPNSKSIWLPATRNELKHLNTLMRNYEQKKWEMGSEWVQCNESISDGNDRLNRTVFECNSERKCFLRTEFQSSQTTELCIEFFYSSNIFGRVYLRNNQSSKSQTLDLEATNGKWRRERIVHLIVSENVNYTLIFEDIGKGFRIGEFRVCSDNEYHITSLKTTSPPLMCSIIPQRNENITMKQIDGTEMSVYPDCPVGTLGKECKIRCSEIIPGNKECNGVIACSRRSCSCLNGLRGSSCEQECEPDDFGAGCKSKCHCKDQNPCNKVTGFCHWGCADGWVGDACDKRCQNGSYGENCKGQCNSNCEGNGAELCNFKTGKCNGGCKAGWEGRLCEKKCQNKYGANCEFDCNCKNGATYCNATTGKCEGGCPDGWFGETCNKKCISGSYGQNCTSKCSGHCRDGFHCNPETGECPRGCDLGWGGENCETRCSAGTYGYNCSKTCPGHCKNNHGCDLKYGNCTEGCAHLYIGEMCDISLILIGVYLLIVLVMAISSALCMAWMLRFKRGITHTDSCNSHTNRPRYSMPKFFRQSSFTSTISCHRAISVPVENEARHQETSDAELNEPTASTSRQEAASTSRVVQKQKPRAQTPPRPMPRSFKFSFKTKLRQTRIPVLPGDPGSQYDDILNLDGGIVQEYQYVENTERESTVESVHSPV